MTELAARDGYENVTIEHVSHLTGISQATFHKHFRNEESCFLDALICAQESVHDEVQRAVNGAPPEHAAMATVAALVRFAYAQPELARLAMNESLAAGPPARGARDTGLTALAHLIEERQCWADPDTALPDIGVRALLGGVTRMLATRLRRGQEIDPSDLSEALATWIDSYGCPARQHRWKTLGEKTPRKRSTTVAALLVAPESSNSRAGTPKEQWSAICRQRILLAAADIATRNGYLDTTVADITQKAGVEEQEFHALFADRHEVFAAVHEFFFQHLLAVTASAYFAGENWPERIWSAGEAFTEVFEQNPTLAYIGFVETHAGGPLAVERLEQSTEAFTIFLREGYEHASASPPSETALEAIAATNTELAYAQVQQASPRHMGNLLPRVTQLVLAPFLGLAATDEFIERKLQA